MSLKVKVKQHKETMQDTVIFITSYNINKYNKNSSLFYTKENFKDLLFKYHITCFASQDSMLTQKGMIKYTTSYDSFTQSTQFHFDICKKNDDIKNYADDIKKMSWILQFNHSLESLLDRTMFNISFYLNMESFLVSVNSQLIQVDPIVYYFNNMIFINFELINYTTGKPFTKDSIYGRDNNYNIIPINGVQYFNEKSLQRDSRRIPDIIFENVIGFIEKVTRNKYMIDSYSYVHNILVLSNSILNINKYFLNVLDAEDIKLNLKNLNTSSSFKYYSSDFLGVLTSISINCLPEVLFDGQILETLKMYFILNQIVSLEITNGLTETINNQMYIDHLSYVSGTPIITLNAIDNIKQTESFKRNKAAIDFKISYLSLLQQRRKNKNSLLLNILLYVLAFIGGISTLQVLQEELHWPFKLCAFILTIIFIGLGIIWVLKEQRK